MLSKALQGAAKGVAVDSDFENVTLLLHGNGTNGAQNNTFIDSSTNNFTITRNGNTTQGTFSPYGSNWSNYFDGTGDYLTASNNVALQLGSSDFTIEGWFYFTQTPNSYNALCQKGIAGDSNLEYAVYLRPSSNTIEFGYTTNGSTYIFISSSSVTINQNTWYHVAVTRSGNTLYFFLNGVAAGSSSLTSTLYTGTASLGIAASNSGTNILAAAYLSNLRIVKGTAVYTAAFTPPTAPLTAITNTSLLTCQSNRFIDNSTNAFAITVNGNTSVQRFSPFSPTAAYASGTIGGSGYFDGTGDYLDIASNAVLTPTGDFTIEFWAYPTSNSGVREWYSKGYGIQIYSYDTLWYVALSSSNAVSYYVNGSFGTLTANAWQHIVLTRSGTSYVGFVNGVATNVVTSSSAPNTGTDVLRIGDFSGSAVYPVLGYVSNVRYVNGTVVYGTSNFTPPTAPLTAITNTQLLLNFTNAGIIDNAMMNDLETVGNAQISTTQSKFGGSSMYFDETGDYLTAPSTQNVAFGTGNFTIECWVRFATSTVGNGQGVFQLSNGYLNSAVRGPAVGTDDTSGKWAIYYGTSSSVHATSIPSTNTWYHVAFVRNSSTSKLYIDGTELISVSDSTNYTDTSFTIGGWYSSSYLLNGYIDDLRITKGVARYTANFTAPTAPFADQ